MDEFKTMAKELLELAPRFGCRKLAALLGLDPATVSRQLFAPIKTLPKEKASEKIAHWLRGIWKSADLAETIKRFLQSQRQSNDAGKGLTFKALSTALLNADLRTLASVGLPDIPPTTGRRLACHIADKVAKSPKTQVALLEWALEPPTVVGKIVGVFTVGTALRPQEWERIADRLRDKPNLLRHSFMKGCHYNQAISSPLLLRSHSILLPTKQPARFFEEVAAFERQRGVTLQDVEQRLLEKFARPLLFVEDIFALLYDLVTLPFLADAVRFAQFIGDANVESILVRIERQCWGLQEIRTLLELAFEVIAEVRSL